MHVLGMPPAFVLSQDQTLKFASEPPLKAAPSIPAPFIQRNRRLKTGSPKTSSPYINADKQRLTAPPPAHPFLTHFVKYHQKRGRLLRARPSLVNTDSNARQRFCHSREISLPPTPHLRSSMVIFDGTIASIGREAEEAPFSASHSVAAAGNEGSATLPQRLPSNRFRRTAAAANPHI